MPQCRVWTFDTMSFALRRRILSIIILSMIFSLSSKADDASNLDANAKSLLEAFKAIRAYRGDADAWKPHMGPWAPYLKGSMIAALGEREKRLYDSAMTLGDCQSVISLQSIGFLLAHPFLQAAHAKPLVGEMFVETVAKTSLDYRYCLRRRDYLEALANLAALDIANVLPVRFHSARRSELGEPEYDSRVRPLVDALCSALRGLAALAIYEDDRRAIESLVNLNERKDIARLPPSQEFYLIERATVLGIDAHARKERRHLLYHKLKPGERIGIERYARNREGRSPLGSGWHCPLPPHNAGTPAYFPFWLQE